jgi:hypothetical protein
LQPPSQSPVCSGAAGFVNNPGVYKALMIFVLLLDFRFIVLDYRQIQVRQLRRCALFDAGCPILKTGFNMSTHKVIVPSEDPDIHGLPKKFQWRCICIATAGLLGVTVVCSIVAAVSSVLALPLFLFGVPLLLFAEIIFSIIYLHKLAILNVQPIKHEPENYDPERTFDKFIRQIKQFEEVEQYLSLWFFGAEFSLIKRQNVEEFVAYAFWYRQRWASSQLCLQCLQIALQSSQHASPAGGPSAVPGGHLRDAKQGICLS